MTDTHKLAQAVMATFLDDDLTDVYWCKHCGEIYVKDIGQTARDVQLNLIHTKECVVTTAVQILAGEFKRVRGTPHKSYGVTSLSPALFFALLIMITVAVAMIYGIGV